MENINLLARELARELLESELMELHIELGDESKPGARVQITVAHVCGCERCVDEREEARAIRRMELDDFSDLPEPWPGAGEHWE